MTDQADIAKIARAVLYEGYLLYPYRRSSLKNANRCMFGTLYPEGWVRGQAGPDRSRFEMQCVLLADQDAALSIAVRFLQNVAGEGVEREVLLEASLAEMERETRQGTFSFTGVEGELHLRAERLSAGAFRLTLEVSNTTVLDQGDAESALAKSMASAHATLAVQGGRFVSLTDPPAELAEAAAGCRNLGVWPVLVGEPGSTDALLASPIILSDYPQVAPESAGDLCDGTEIDEILTLRLLTLTEEEKSEVRASEERARQILEQAESLPAEHVMRLHGVIRGLGPAIAFGEDRTLLERISVGGIELKPGDAVRLHPSKRADIFDTVLDGRVALIAGIEQDFEDNVHVAVVLEDDPGRDLGEMRQIGHRFFFAPSELEPA
ncbi:MAG TPA: hypothetical protein VFW44_19300 [Bryobacteraceae bacterium]|nr:hypothetical protein [Bryobacteraceae bacterium]